MKTFLIACLVALVVPLSGHCITLTFDEFPAGTPLIYSSYTTTHRVRFSEEFRASDHTSSSWGLPHSPTNVLTSDSTDFNPTILFGRVYTYGVDVDPVQAVSAYFSTQMDRMVKITGYHYDRTLPLPGQEVTSVVIGASGESWDNRYVEMNVTSGLPINILEFEGVNSQDELTGFCLDDMTVTPIPEPSSLLALGGGVMGLAGLARRRRR